MKRMAMFFIAAAILFSGLAACSPVRAGEIFPDDDGVDGPWLRLPEFDAEIDDSEFYTDVFGVVVYRRAINGGELELWVERIEMDEISEQAVLELIADRENVDADEIYLSDATELMEENSYEYPCVAASYETEDGARDNSELIFPVEEYIFRLIVSISSDAETDYDADDMIAKWISKIDFVGMQ